MHRTESHEAKRSVFHVAVASSGASPGELCSPPETTNEQQRQYRKAQYAGDYGHDYALR